MARDPRLARGLRLLRRELDYLFAESRIDKAGVRRDLRPLECLFHKEVPIYFGLAHHKWGHRSRSKRHMFRATRAALFLLSYSGIKWRSVRDLRPLICATRAVSYYIDQQTKFGPLRALPASLHAWFPALDATLAVTNGSPGRCCPSHTALI